MSKVQEAPSSNTHSPTKRNVLQHKKTKARFSRLLRHPDRNGAGLFSKEKISKGGNESGKSEEKRISGEAYDINKQTIYTEERDQKIEERNTPRIGLGN